jgi:hypothetical protein
VIVKPFTALAAFIISLAIWLPVIPHNLALGEREIIRAWFCLSWWPYDLAIVLRVIPILKPLRSLNDYWLFSI